MPAVSIKRHPPRSLQELLCAPYVVFPSLAKVHPVDHSVDRVVTKVWLKALNQWLKLRCPK